MMPNWCFGKTHISLNRNNYVLYFCLSYCTLDGIDVNYDNEINMCAMSIYATRAQK